MYGGGCRPSWWLVKAFCGMVLWWTSIDQVVFFAGVGSGFFWVWSERSVDGSELIRLFGLEWRFG